MKIFFTINDKSDYHYDLFKACIISLKKNTQLDPYCIFLGYTKQCPIIGFLEKHDVKILPYQLSFFDKLKNKDFSDFNLNDFYTKLYKNHKHLHNNNLLIMESVRIDLPQILDKYNIADNHVLYSDVDVLFLSDIILPSISQTIGAALRGKYFNNGILLFNTLKYKTKYDDFKKFYIDNNFNFKTFWGSQGAFNEYFTDDVYDIGVENNWHVFWGINNNAKIIHFCGLKPDDYRLIYNNRIENYTPWFIDLANNNRNSIEYYMKVKEQYHE